MFLFSVLERTPSIVGRWEEPGLDLGGSVGSLGWDPAVLLDLGRGQFPSLSPPGLQLRPSPA